MAKTHKSKAPIAPKRAQAAKKAAPVKKKTQAVTAKKAAPVKKVVAAKKPTGKVATPATSPAAAKAKPLKKAATATAPGSAQKSMSALTNHSKESDKDKNKKSTTIVRSAASAAPTSSGDSKKGGAKAPSGSAAQHQVGASEKAVDKSSARSAEKNAEKTTEKTTERTTDKHSEKSPEKAAETTDMTSASVSVDPVADDKPAAEPKARARKAKEESSVFENEEEPAEVVLTDADGRRYCRVKDCDQLSTVDNYCRYHYLLFWKNIQVRKKILSEGKLERYIEELTARYPDKYLDMLRKDLRNEKDFLAAIQELEIDEANVDNEYEDEAQSYLEEVRGMSGETSAREEEDF